MVLVLVYMDTECICNVDGNADLFEIAENAIHAKNLVRAPGKHECFVLTQQNFSFIAIF